MSSETDGNVTVTTPDRNEKKPRKPRGASKMIVGVEMTLGELHDQRERWTSDMMTNTRVILISGRATTVKAGEALAEKEKLTGEVVISCERSRFTAVLEEAWVKGCKGK